MVMWQQLLIPPLVGGIVGYFTNSLAVRMLFHPLEAVYIGGKKLPFTPGLIPAEQDRLAENIAQLVVDTLLTKDDFHGLAQKLLTPERIDQGVDKVIDALLIDFDDAQKFEALSDDLSHFLSEKVLESLPDLIQNLSEKSLTPERIHVILDQIIDSILDDFHLSPDMAQMVSEQLLETVLSPDNMRLSLVGLLTPQNIQVLDELMRAKIGGRYGIFLFFINLPDALVKLRAFLNTEKERSNELLAEVTDMMHLSDTIYRGILGFDPKHLPWEKMEVFKESLVIWIHEYLSRNYEVILPPLLEQMDLPQLVRGFLNKLNPRHLPEATLSKIKLGASQFIHQYLERELLTVVERMFKMANLESIIADKIRAFSPARMESIILDVSRKELNMIVVLGGILGVLIGCLQASLFLFL